MGKPAVLITPSAAGRREPEPLAQAQKIGRAMARRARIVFAAAAGLDNTAVCAEAGTDANTVSKWRRRSEHTLPCRACGTRAAAHAGTAPAP